MIEELLDVLSAGILNSHLFLFRTQSSLVDHVVATCNVTTGKDPASCSLLPPGAGYYLLHATATDRRKNPLAASVMHAMLLRVWLRPVRRQERVGEHNAVVCHCVYRKPSAAIRSMFGVAIGPP